jgi:hypothetical protein
MVILLAKMKKLKNLEKEKKWKESDKKRKDKP